MSFNFEGFTTIVGRNFIGKSAALRAINAALTNKQGTDFIRWGEKFCEVHIKTKDIEILWHKEDNNNFYKINNEASYEKIGNQPVPKPVSKAGFGLVTVGKEKINLLYAQQFFPLFLIDRMDSKSADLLISIYGLDKLYKAIDLCAKDQRKNTDLLKLRKVDLVQAEKDLEKYKDFDALKSIVTTLDATKLGLKQEKDLIDKMKIWFERLIKSTVEIKKFRPVREAIIPSYETIETGIKEYKKLTEYLNKASETKKDLLRLREVNKIFVPAAEEIDKNLKDITTLCVLQKKYEGLSIQIVNLKKVKDINIPEVPDRDINELEVLKDKYSRLASIAADVKSFRISVEAVKKDLEKTNTALNKYDHCPTCGAELKKE
jgi:DNA repair ATPase RecN